MTSRIQLNSAVMLGKLVIRGTRIPVELIIRKLSEGVPEAALRMPTCISLSPLITSPLPRDFGVE
jgi:Protein of unknown function (DUF433)